MKTPGVTYSFTKKRYIATCGIRKRLFRDPYAAQLAADEYRRSQRIPGIRLNFPRVGECDSQGRKRTQ